MIDLVSEYQQYQDATTEDELNEEEEEEEEEEERQSTSLGIRDLLVYSMAYIYT